MELKVKAPEPEIQRLKEEIAEMLKGFYRNDVIKPKATWAHQEVSGTAVIGASHAYKMGAIRVTEEGADALEMSIWHGKASDMPFLVGWIMKAAPNAQVTYVSRTEGATNDPSYEGKLACATSGLDAHSGPKTWAKWVKPAILPCVGKTRQEAEAALREHFLKPLAIENAMSRGARPEAQGMGLEGLVGLLNEEAETFVDCFWHNEDGCSEWDPARYAGVPWKAGTYVYMFPYVHVPVSRLLSESLHGRVAWVQGIPFLDVGPSAVDVPEGAHAYRAYTDGGRLVAVAPLSSLDPSPHSSILLGIREIALDWRDWQFDAPYIPEPQDSAWATGKEMRWDEYAANAEKMAEPTRSRPSMLMPDATYVAYFTVSGKLDEPMLKALTASILVQRLGGFARLYLEPQGGRLAAKVELRPGRSALEKEAVGAVRWAARAANADIQDAFGRAIDDDLDQPFDPIDEI